MEIARRLDIELVELPRWTYCGIFPSLVNDNLMGHVAPLRNLIHVQEMNENDMVGNEHCLVTFCSMCFHTLKETISFSKIRRN